jgi:hypothetical protein
MTAAINPALACFPGLRDAVLPSPPPTAGLDMEDIEEDITAEQETLLDVMPSKEPDGAQLQTTLMEASKGVTEGTDAEYRRCA